MLIDSHCHLHDREFFSKEQAAAMLKNARQNGVQQIICIGTDREDSLVARDFASKHNNVFWSFGIHPSGAADIKTENEIKLRKSQKLIAIGETGLDYHYTKNKAEQIALFETLIDLAQKHNLPLIFHVREAFDDFFAVVDNFPKLKGVVHSFSDNKKNLRKALDRDFYIGVNGLATYSTLPLPPLERILLETDAPFLTPVPNRGKINEPAYIKDIARWLSIKLGVSETKIAEQTTQNVRRLFNISHSKARD